MRAAVVVFPGSNCDQDCRWALEEVLGARVQMVWHKEQELGPVDLVLLPGGFSYGDYLRAGAIARYSPVMKAVRDHAERGGLVLGICNGFQILLEARLLEGAMRMNIGRRFVCRDVFSRVERAGTAFSHGLERGQVLRIPVAHHEGSWVAPEEVLREVEDRDQVLLRYCRHDGSLSDGANPNGSASHVAGLLSAGGNVLGMMPHPERAAAEELGGTDGRLLLRSLLTELERRAA